MSLSDNHDYSVHITKFNSGWGFETKILIGENLKLQVTIGKFRQLSSKIIKWTKQPIDPLPPPRTMLDPSVVDVLLGRSVEKEKLVAATG